MGIGFVRIGKLAMATVGTVYTVLNIESLYNQTKHFLLPSSYPFLFFHVILLSILFQCSSFTSRFSHLLLKLRHFTTGNSPRNPTTHQPPPEDHLPRGYSDIWSRIQDQESYKGHKEDYSSLNDPFTYSNQPHPFGEGDREVILEEDLEDVNERQVEEDIGGDHEGEDGKDSMEETWKAIMEGKLKKCNTWDVTPSIEQMKGKPSELESSKSFAVVEEEDRGKDSRPKIGGGQWDWRRMDREVVMPRDELNQRADDFINKIKNSIRLERLQSYNLFIQLINRRNS